MSSALLTFYTQCFPKPLDHELYDWHIGGLIFEFLDHHNIEWIIKRKMWWRYDEIHINSQDLSSVVNYGNVVLLEKFIIAHKQLIPYKKLDWDLAIYLACYHNHCDIVERLVGTIKISPNSGLRGACYSGNKNLVKLMIDLGATNWNAGLAGACCAGHLDLAIMMIQLGADDYDNGLYEACYGGNLALAEYIIGLNIPDLDINSGLLGAVDGHTYGPNGNRSYAVIDYIINKGADDLNCALHLACFERDYRMADYLIKSGATSCGLCGGARHTFRLGLP